MCFLIVPLLALVIKSVIEMSDGDFRACFFIYLWGSKKTNDYYKYIYMSMCVCVWVSSWLCYVSGPWAVAQTQASNKTNLLTTGDVQHCTETFEEGKGQQ